MSNNKHKESCNCLEISCLKNCEDNHTHKEFWCEKCHPERYVKEEPKEEDWVERLIEFGEEILRRKGK